MIQEECQAPFAFDHERLSVYQKIIGFVGQAALHVSEWSSMHSVRDHLERASSSMALNLVEAVAIRCHGRRIQQLDYALGSSLECAACCDVAAVKGLLPAERQEELKRLLIEITRMLVGLRKSWQGVVRETAVAYSASGDVEKTLFNHERLEVYRVALELVRWIENPEFRLVLSRKKWRLMDEAATSIALNVAEGNGRFFQLDHRRFLGIAKLASVRAAAHLDMILKRQEMHEDMIREGKSLLRRILAMLPPLEDYWASQAAIRSVVEE